MRNGILLIAILMIFSLGYSVCSASSIITTTTTTAKPGDTSVAVPVTITNGTGLKGFDITITYDTGKLTATGVSNSHSNLSYTLMPRTDSTPGDGTLRIVGVGGDSEALATPSATLTEALFNVSSSASTGSITLTLTLTDSVGLTSLTVQNGTLNIQSAALAMSPSDNQVVAVGTTLKLTASGGEGTYTWSITDTPYGTLSSATGASTVYTPSYTSQPATNETDVIQCTDGTSTVSITVTIPASTGVKGDADSSGDVTINDLNTVIDIILSGFSGVKNNGADPDSDGDVDINDLNGVIDIILA